MNITKITLRFFITRLAAAGFLLLCLLSGCAKRSVSAPLTIDSHEWKLATIQRAEDGTVIACSATEKAAFEEAAELEITCMAIDGKLTLSNSTDRVTYTGTYTESTASPTTSLYEITLEGESGNAIVAMTVYYDQTQKPTLILSTKDYALNFFAG